MQLKLIKGWQKNIQETRDSEREKLAGTITENTIRKGSEEILSADKKTSSKSVKEKTDMRTERDNNFKDYDDDETLSTRVSQLSSF
jgi:hypothetical protein